MLFSQKIEMKLKKTEVVFDTVISTYDLTFDNSAYTTATEALLKSRENSLPVRAGILFEMFPFCILFQVCLLRFLKELSSFSEFFTLMDLSHFPAERFDGVVHGGCSSDCHPQDDPQEDHRLL